MEINDLRALQTVLPLRFQMQQEIHRQLKS